MLLARWSINKIALTVLKQVSQIPGMLAHPPRVRMFYDFLDNPDWLRLRWDHNGAKVVIQIFSGGSVRVLTAPGDYRYTLSDLPDLLDHLYKEKWQRMGDLT